jgi:hypothetical protein
MARRNVPKVKEGVLLAAAFLLMAPPALAGGRVTAGRPAAPPQPAPAVRVVYLPAPVSVVVTVPGQPAKPAVYANLRGPDGQVRRFAVEGGRAAIQYQQVVLRPGQSVTVQVAAR